MNILQKLALKKIYKEVLGSGVILSSIKITLLCVSVLNIIAICFLIRNVSFDFDNKRYLIYPLNLFISILIVFNDFIPTLKKVVIYDISYIPISTFDKLFIWFSSSQLSFFNIILVSNLLAFLFSPFYNFISFISSLVFILIAIFISFIIRFNLDYSFRFKYRYILVSTTLILGFLLFNISLFFDYLDLSLVQYLYVISTYLALFFLVIFSLFKIRYKESSTNYHHNYSLLTFSAKKIEAVVSSRLLLSVAIGLFFKILLLSFNYYSINVKGEYLFKSEFLFAIVVAPVVVFSYGLNNLFSFNSNFYYNIIQRSCFAKKIFFQHYLTTSFVFVFIDLVITIGVLYFMDSTEVLFKHIIYYLISIIFLLPMGLIGSLYFPVKINKKLDFFSNAKMYTNPIISIISILGVYLIYTFQSSYTLLFVALLFIVNLHFIFNKFRLIKYKFISKLYI